MNKMNEPCQAESQAPPCANGGDNISGLGVLMAGNHSHTATLHLAALVVMVVVDGRKIRDKQRDDGAQAIWHTASWLPAL